MIYEDTNDSERLRSTEKPTCPTASCVISVPVPEETRRNNISEDDIRSCKVRLTTLSEGSSQSTYQQTFSLNETDFEEKAIDPTSPQVHLSKLQSIHRQVKARRRLKQIRKTVYFIVTRILPIMCILTSISLLLFGYFYNVHNLIITGSIVLLATSGVLVQLCFTRRTGPNKFNPMSVPFSIPAEDLQSVKFPADIEPPRTAESVKRNQSFAEGSTNQANEPQSAKTLNVVLNDLQAKRLSLALTRVANSKFQFPNTYETDKTSGVLRMARRLTMASSAMGMVNGDHLMMCEPNWLTGTHIRHGVRRSLAWNASGASRFYERNYD
ncbi:hypothetical protein EG68_06039 [Paragonimus skrjabini miyazakii]|uniref:Transmembrane protein n=1 Tax=Paragonimus skrjabini miyazakii TaxID=59628 RepID=A0A8S9YPU6_9TREM|nr:hypothetical protein EG68_06039 [Paragonimus skrjabini miyazakii]